MGQTGSLSFIAILDNSSERLISIKRTAFAMIKIIVAISRKLQ